MPIHFYKYHGTGNDFILIDNRQGAIAQDSSTLISHLCHRRFGIGADGLILIENSSMADFNMLYFNADGGRSSFCGNGGRCAVAFAHLLGLCSQQTTFEAADGMHQAQILPQGEVELGMRNVDRLLRIHENSFLLDTGSPHLVNFVADAAAVDVYQQGKFLREHSDYIQTGAFDAETMLQNPSFDFSALLPNTHLILYSPSLFAKGEAGGTGVNVNFVTAISSKLLQVRTYERGVEAETYSCGTGVVAAAIAHHAHMAQHRSPANKAVVFLPALSDPNNQVEHFQTEVQTPGGNLRVTFDYGYQTQAFGYFNVRLSGAATPVFEGQVSVA